FAPHTFARFQRRFQVMPRDLNGQRVRDQPSGPVLVFHPRRMRQGHPNRTPVHQELYVDRVGMARGDSHDQGLINTVSGFLAPAVGGSEVGEHARKLYRRRAPAANSQAGRTETNFRPAIYDRTEYFAISASSLPSSAELSCRG